MKRPSAAPLRIATRKSQLALWQAEHVAGLLRRAHAGLEVELVPMVTQGDRIQDRSLAAIGGKGLFIKELEVALEEERADIAVHSMKDLPGDLPEGLTIAAVLERADARDALLTGSAGRLDDLPRGAHVGTSSLRRHAIVLACAGLIRLGLESRISARLDPKIFLPAVAQGIIGIECRRADSRTLRLVTLLESQDTRIAMDAERAFAHRLGGSCQSPIAAHARLEGQSLLLDGLVAEPDGSRLIRDTASGSIDDPAALGRLLADRILAAGAGPLLERLRAG